jgi:hypothetical protein
MSLQVAGYELEMSNVHNDYVLKRATRNPQPVTRTA